MTVSAVADVYTDGSCVPVTPEKNRSQGPRGYGGWCAVVEHGHDGWVRRGAAEDTNATRMELVAVVEGLRSLPPNVPARLWFDCTVVLSIRDRLDRHGYLRADGARDADLWVQVAGEFAKRRVELRLIEKREKVPQHQRAHTFAGGESRRLREEVRRAIAPRLPEWASRRAS